MKLSTSTLATPKIFKVTNHSASYTLSANSAKWITATDFSITDQTGYSLVGIIKFSTGNDLVYCRAMLRNTSGNVMALFNTSSNSVSASASCQILWVRSENIDHTYPT